MIDLTKLDPSEAERIAYAEGFTGVADLFARIEALEHAAHVLATALDLCGGGAMGDEIDAAREQLREVLK